jgi:hypothetical protein
LVREEVKHMAEGKYYAWTNFPRTDVHPSKQIKVGDEVSPSDFATEETDTQLASDGKEEFNELVKVGAIRKQPYPIERDDDGNFVFEGSPREHALMRAAEMEQGVYTDVDNTWRVPQLQARAESAMDAAEGDYDPGDVAGLGGNEEAAAEQDAAEQEQGTRRSLEGRGLTPGSAARRTADKKK